MFERFTEDARQVVVLSQEEARLLGHMHIGTEHLLLGLVRQEDEAVVALLSAHDLSLERAREDVLELVPRGTEKLSGQIPFTPQAKAVLELALEQARALEHNVIAPLHLMLGLSLETEGVAATILIGHGVDAERVERVLRDSDLGRPRADVIARRLAVVEARLAAAARRVEVMELTGSAADQPGAVTGVANLLGIDEELARDVTNMRLAYFTTAEVDRLGHERDMLRKKLDQSR